MMDESGHKEHEDLDTVKSQSTVSECVDDSSPRTKERFDKDSPSKLDEKSSPDETSCPDLDGKSSMDMFYRVQYFCPPNQSSATVAILLFLFHMLPFTSIPAIVNIAILYVCFLHWGWIVLATITTVNLLLLATPLYYSPTFRNKFRGFYMLAARYVPSAKYIVPERPFPEDKAYIFAIHPHGRMFFCITIFSMLNNIWSKSILRKGDLFMAAATGFFSLPLLRNAFALVGIISVDKESIVTKLREKNHVAIAVGGVKEVLLGTQDDADVIYLQNRIGFCKIAIAENAGIVPVYAFNENQLFSHNSEGFLNFFRWINKHYRIGVPFMRGRFHLPMPYRKDVLIVVGEPLFPMDGESLRDFHQRYIGELKKLFQKFVHLSPNPHHKLIIT